MESGNTGYRAICFDLDGTLLPMDLDWFMRSYFERIAAYGGARGLDPARFVDSIRKGTFAMMANDGSQLNREVFWKAFADAYGDAIPAGIDAHALADSFYEDDFARIGDGFAADPVVARTIAMLAAKGYPLVLTTMPLFPRRAVEHRLGWAGVDPSAFRRITTYENSKTAKPHLAYYAENLAAMGLRGEEVLMVGNNTEEDLAFMGLGADAYLVTDCLLDPIGFDVGSVKHGTFDQFAAWAAELPDCACPAEAIDDGPIDGALRDEALGDAHGMV